MGLRNFFRRLGASVEEAKECGAFEDSCCRLARAMDVYAARNLALHSCIDTIARTLAKCEFRTYEQGQEKRGELYYRLNVAPNNNESRVAWLQRLLLALYTKGEALVVEAGGALVVADAFTVDRYVFKDWVFRDVVVDGYQLTGDFFRPKTMYFRLSPGRAQEALWRLNDSYAEMLRVGGEFFARAKSVRGLLNVNAMETGRSSEDRERMMAALNSRFAALKDGKHAIVPLPAGYSFTDLGRDSTGTTSRDQRALIDDIFDFTARALGIPPALFRGEVAGLGDVFDLYLGECIEPLARMLEAELNLQLFTASAYEAGSRVTVDTKKLRHVELLSLAGLDKVISAGVLTINEARREFGIPSLDDPRCDMPLITKNYGFLEGGNDRVETEGS